MRVDRIDTTASATEPSVAVPNGRESAVDAGVLASMVAE